MKDTHPPLSETKITASSASHETPGCHSDTPDGRRSQSEKHNWAAGLGRGEGMAKGETLHVRDVHVLMGSGIWRGWRGVGLAGEWSGNIQM